MTELEKAARMALEALRYLRDQSDCDIDPFRCAQSKANLAISQLNNALAPALAATERNGEPVAWAVMNGLSKYQVCGSKKSADVLCAEMQKRHDLSGSLAAFHVQPLYTSPQVPEDVQRDAERYRKIRQGSAWPCAFASNDAPEPLTGDDLDAAIDAARKGE